MLHKKCFLAIFILCIVTHTLSGMNKKEQEKYMHRVDNNWTLTIHKSIKDKPVFITKIKHIASYTFTDNAVIVKHEKGKKKPYIQVYQLNPDLTDKERPLFKKPLQSLDPPLFNNSHIMITKKQDNHKRIIVYNVKNPQPIKLVCPAQLKPCDFKVINNNVLLVSFEGVQKNSFETDQIYDLEDEASIFKTFPDTSMQITLHNNDSLAISSSKKIIQIYNVIQAKHLFFQNPKHTTQYNISPSSRYLILEHEVQTYIQDYKKTMPTRQIKVYDLQHKSHKKTIITYNLRQKFHTRDYTCNEYKFSPNERFLVLKSKGKREASEQETTVWDLERKSKLFERLWGNRLGDFPKSPNCLGAFHFLGSSLLVFISTFYPVPGQWTKNKNENNRHSSKLIYSRHHTTFSRYYNKWPQDLIISIYNLNYKKPKKKRSTYKSGRYIVGKNHLFIEGEHKKMTISLEPKIQCSDDEKEHVTLLQALLKEENDNDEKNIFEQKTIRLYNQKLKATAALLALAN